MPRPSNDRLAVVEPADLETLLDLASDRLIILLDRIVRLSGSDSLRREIMATARFPMDDVPSFVAINKLALHGAMRPTDLAQLLETGRSNATKIIQRLADAGLVVRTPDGTDGRGVLVALTQPGRYVAQRIIDSERARLNGSVAKWPKEDVALLERLLGELVAAFDFDDVPRLRRP